jgi:FkbM family methyltransferase
MKFKDTYLFQLVHWKQILSGQRFKITHYSQFGEDIILQKILHGKNGFYVDVGAFHPFHYSNTYVLFKRGWKGINIDPNSKSIDLFKKYRKNDINLHLGIAKEKTVNKYYVYNHQSCNTFSKTQVEENLTKKHLTLLKTEDVACVPLKEVFEKHLPPQQQIDVMSVDVEGMDLEVLKTNDWVRYRPKVIVIESDLQTGKDLLTSPVYAYLSKLDYDLVAWMGASLIFKKV